MNIHQNLAIRLLRILRYNKARSERALVLLAPQKKALFHVVPFLLHINHPRFPGYVDHPRVPFGLNNYSLRDTLVAALLEVFPQNREQIDNMKTLWPKARNIDSLVLMGSIGTIAQSEDSDFDYWACIDGNKLDDEQKQLLQQKLTKVEQWADEVHELEVHFFLSEIERVRNNDFGEADGESSGSAQAVFLKTEFYTTNIVVAGKAPFWWLMPDTTTDAQYPGLIETLKQGNSPDPNWFMDLGNIERMDPTELFGAAIWQISKAMDSPFKSVLKMAKLEVFLENIEHELPLCNVLKKTVHNGGKAPGDLDHVDPYALMFDKLIEHYAKHDSKDITRLLQLSLYLKCGCALSVAAAEGGDHFKRRIMQSYVKQWGWTPAQVRRVDRIRYWDFPELSRLSRQVHSFLIGCYRRISAKLEQGTQTVSQEDMTVIGRKIETYYSKKPDKVEYLRSVFDDELYCKTVTIKVELSQRTNRQWSIYSGDQIGQQSDSLQKVHLKSSEDPIEIIVWAVWNRIMDSRTKILLDYHAEPVDEDDLIHLTKCIEKVFRPVKLSALTREPLLAPVRVLNCMAVVNFESRRTKVELDTIKVIYSTSWGEVYIKSGLESLKALHFDLLDVSPTPGTFIWVPQATPKQRLYESFSIRSGLDFSTRL